MIGIHKKRNKIILPFIIGKEVFDIGSLSHGTDTDFFSFIKANAKAVLGSDILRGDRDDIIEMNCEDIKLTRRYDVITAGEVIEHLESPKLFLQSAKNALSEDGVLIVTTPNCLSPWYFFHGCKNAEHTHWHDEYTLKHVFDLNGYEVVLFDYYSRSTNNPLNWLFQLACKFFPRFNLHLIIIAKVR